VVVLGAVGMVAAAPAGERGCGAGGQVRPEEAPYPPLQNTSFGDGTIADSPVWLARACGVVTKAAQENEK